MNHKLVRKLYDVCIHSKVYCSAPTLRCLLSRVLLFLDEELPGVGAFGGLLMFISYILIILFFPFSLFYTIKVSPVAIDVITCTTAAACATVCLGIIVMFYRLSLNMKEL